MNYDFVYMMEDVLDELSGAASLSSTLSLVSYVFISLAIYTIARRREIKKAWMAWVPVLNVWILGSISDQYRYVVKGEIKNKRKILLTIHILNVFAVCAALVKLIVSLVMAFSAGPGLYTMEMIRLLWSILVFFIPVVILNVLSLVFRAMALYDLYSSCEPDNKVIYLVLSLIPGVNQITQPLFLFLCRNKDDGMPPRRDSFREDPVE